MVKNSQNKRLNDIITVVSNVSMGDLSQKIEISGNDEFAALGMAINEMNQNLKHYIKDIFEKILAVVSDVSMGDYSSEVEVAKDDSFAALGLAVNEIIYTLRETHEKLKGISETDALTNIPNRRKLFDILKIDIERAKRYSIPLSVAIIDLDHFKKVNDKYGHIKGDDVLRNTAKILHSNIRKADVLGRYGGEEFVIVVVGNNVEKTKIMCEKLRKMVERYHHPCVGSVTISIGMAEFDKNDSEETLLSKADKALYAAKEKGRNRIEAFRG